MLNLTRDTQMDKAKDTLRDVVSYADQIVRDERLRADILSAIGHGAEAGDRIKRDINEAGIATRLVEDRKLRKKLRATLDDLDNASERLRHKQRRRVRKMLLIVVGAGAVAAIVQGTRHRLGDGMAEPTSGTIPVT